MALPSTQTEVTTRRIASLISELWKKIKNAFLLKTSRGAANGVASLDANGKVPTSQLPKIGTSGIEDDAITAALVKDGETLPVNISGSGQLKEYTLINGTYLIGTLGYDTPSRYGGVIFLATTRDYQDLNNVFLIYLQRGRYIQGTPDDTVSAKATIIDGRVHSINSDGLGFYYNELSDKSTEFYIKVGRSQFVTISLLSNVNGIFNIIEPTSTSLPSSAIEFSYYNNVLMTPGQKGRDSVPVYVNNSGYIVECNKVASLDSNGKVPTSQLPTVPTGNLPANSSSSAGIVASGSGQNYQVWMTDATGVPAWRNQCFVPELEINDSTTKSRLLYTISTQSATQWPGCSFMISIRDGGGAGTGLYRLDIRCGEYNAYPKAIRLYTVLPGTTSLPNSVKIYFKYDTTNDCVYIYATVLGYSILRMTPIYTTGYGMVSYSNTDVTIPKDAIQLDSIGQMLCSKPTGSPSVPVYIGNNGTIEPCNVDLNNKRNFPKLSYFDHGFNKGVSNQYIKIAEISCNGSHLDHPIIFRMMSRYQGQYSIFIQLKGADSKYPSIDYFRVISPYERGKSYATIKLTYVDNSTYRVYSLWSNPGAWSQLESVVDTDYTMRPLITMISGVYSTSLTNPMDPTYQKDIFTKNAGNSVGSASVPVYVDSNGEVLQCTGGSLINYEVTSAVPSSPTAGKFYFIS